ncbi:pyruvate formate lyase family protein [Clostridium vitabionis]|uniref:pyruvate formate lyase family protein n=1 Tax=Clostridium vitabionis TaxID=2784388 RepID=UPI00188D8435|nr:pyruvate formate lyase family protein [Clostridium vitabionis]
MNAVNDLSYMIPEATAEVQLYQPPLSVRFSLAQNSCSILKKIAEVIKLGTGLSRPGGESSRQRGGTQGVGLEWWKKAIKQ